MEFWILAKNLASLNFMNVFLGDFWDLKIQFTCLDLELKPNLAQVWRIEMYSGLYIP